MAAKTKGTLPDALGTMGAAASVAVAGLAELAMLGKGWKGPPSDKDARRIVKLVERLAKWTATPPVQADEAAYVAIRQAAIALGTPYAIGGERAASGLDMADQLATELVTRLEQGGYLQRGKGGRVRCDLAKLKTNWQPQGDPRDIVSLWFLARRWPEMDWQALADRIKNEVYAAAERWQKQGESSTPDDPDANLTDTEDKAIDGYELAERENGVRTDPAAYKWLKENHPDHPSVEGKSESAFFQNLKRARRKTGKQKRTRGKATASGSTLDVSGGGKRRNNRPMATEEAPSAPPAGPPKRMTLADRLEKARELVNKLYLCENGNGRNGDCRALAEHLRAIGCPKDILNRLNKQAGLTEAAAFLDSAEKDN